MSETQLTISDEERERMADFVSDMRENGQPNPRILERNVSADEADQRAEWRGRFRVTERMCNGMSERVDDGDELASIADDFGVSPRVVKYHTDGECDHNHNTVIDPERCAAIRELARDGLEYTEIAEWCGAGDSTTVRTHAKGSCTCDRYHDVEPYDVRRAPERAVETTPGQCAEWRTRVRHGDVTPVDIARELSGDRSVQTVRNHVYGRCTCDHDTESPEPPHNHTPKGDEAFCATLRRCAREKDMTPNAVSKEEWCDLSPKSVMYHVYGRCTCDNSEEPLKPKQAPKMSYSRCAEIRERIRETGESAAAVSRDPDVVQSATSVRRHAYGRCTCPHETPAVEK